jgi:membrane protein CcdC involved in cytochrome C biogenesis
VAAGAALGFILVRTMRFWSDQATGELWMKGGALFALILVATIVLRFGVRAVLTGSLFGSASVGGPQQHGFLYDLSADLLFLTLGLWVARAYLVYQRHRAHVAAG